jgi:ABC-type polysaccharide/polyol phosphate transport system ATPase subunit
MSPDGTVAVNTVWKRFKADSRRPMLRDEVERLFSRRGAEDADRWRWVLRQIDFRLEPGEAVGLFGTNGSGKSTLLKILTRIMYPTAGTVDVRGRVGALIELRAGIHPELTGRENVFMYGSILGLDRSTITRRFDEIVGFAELEDAIDRQVKFYSSGMAMRIGFAVAAFLEPHVLLVDEVMAVGDAAFQQKCLDRMRTVIAAGTTVVFVSHDLATIEAICSRGIWLQDGVVQADARVRDALAHYRQQIEEVAAHQGDDDAPVRFGEAQVSGRDGPPTSHQPLRIRVDVEVAEAMQAAVTVGITEGPATPTLLVREVLDLPAGRSRVECELADLPLPAGKYFVWTVALDEAGLDLSAWQPRGSFDVRGPDLDPAPPGVMRLAPVHVDAAWSVG